MKGRIVWVFWLVVVLAALTATASYAWLAMNTEARLGGFEVELESDSIYLEISAEAEENYGTAALQPGGYGACHCALGHCTEHLPNDAYCSFPRSERLLLHPELPDTGGCNQL